MREADRNAELAFSRPHHSLALAGGLVEEDVTSTVLSLVHVHPQPTRLLERPSLGVVSHRLQPTVSTDYKGMSQTPSHVSLSRFDFTQER